MTKKDIILYVLSIAHNNILSPVQIQKLLFLIDEEISYKIDKGCKIFNFIAYDYGPFDKTVYDELQQLEQQGLVETLYSASGRKYQLKKTLEETDFNSLSEEVKSEIKSQCDFVQNCSFKELLVNIYRKYPKMAINTAFPHWVTK